MNAPRPHRLGLVVGKFSPLHLGHEQLIHTALACCDEVLVLGYSQPPLPGCGRERRERWLQQRFPASQFPQLRQVQLDDETLAQRCAARGIACRPLPPNEAPDALHQDYLAWLLAEVLQARPDAMLAGEAYLQPCAQRLSQALGQRVLPLPVDPARQRVPISASRIRADVHAHRQWLAPQVYRDFVPRVLLLGGESTGKSTLAQALAQAHQTCWVPEYGREHWLARGGQLQRADLLEIARVQVEREEAAWLQACGLLLCDTSPLTTLGYAGWMFGEQPAALVQAAARRYDLVVLCAPDFGFVQDGTRQGQAFQARQQAWYEARLAAWPGPWLRAWGPLAQRMAQVEEALARLPPWAGPVRDSVQAPGAR